MTALSRQSSSACFTLSLRASLSSVGCPPVLTPWLPTSWTCGPARLITQVHGGARNRQHDGRPRLMLTTPSLFTGPALRSAAEQSQESRWIRGHGWADDLWQASPHRSWLDRACPHNPVFLTRRDNHMAIINSKAGSPSPSPHPIFTLQQLVRQTLAGTGAILPYSGSRERQACASGMAARVPPAGAAQLQSRGARASMLSGRPSWPARATDTTFRALSGCTSAGPSSACLIVERQWSQAMSAAVLFRRQAAWPSREGAWLMGYAKCMA